MFCPNKQRYFEPFVCLDHETKVVQGAFCEVRAFVQCCFTSTETIRLIRDGEPRTATAPELCRVHVGLSSEGFSLGACVCVCVGYSLMINGWLVYSACSIGEGRWEPPRLFVD